jgi:hypothetical protein
MIPKETIDKGYLELTDLDNLEGSGSQNVAQHDRAK